MSIVGGLRYVFEGSFWAEGTHVSRQSDRGALDHEMHRHAMLSERDGQWVGLWVFLSPGCVIDPEMA